MGKAKDEFSNTLADDYPDFVKFIEAVWNGENAVFKATNKENVALYSQQAVDKEVRKARTFVENNEQPYSKLSIRELKILLHHHESAHNTIEHLLTKETEEDKK